MLSKISILETGDLLTCFVIKSSFRTIIPNQYYIEPLCRKQDSRGCLTTLVMISYNGIKYDEYVIDMFGIRYDINHNNDVNDEVWDLFKWRLK